MMAGSVLFLAPLGHAKKELVDGIDAFVNKRLVLHSEIMDKILNGPLILVSSYPAKESASQEEKAREDKINTALVLERVQELGIKVTPEEQDDQLHTLLGQKKNAQLDLTELQAFLAQNNKTMEGFLEDLETQMLVMRFMGREIMPQVKTTDRDVQAAFLQQSQHRDQSINIQFRHLLIGVRSGESVEHRAQKKKWAEEAYEKLQAGKEFQDVVRLYADAESIQSPSAKPLELKLSDLDAKLRAALEPIVKQSLETEKNAKTSIPSYTSPVEMADGYHILYLVKSEFAENETFRQNKEAIEQKLRQDLRQQTLENWIQKARSKAKVLEVVR